MNKAKITTIASCLGLPKFRQEQLRAAFFQQHLTTFEEISTLGRGLRANMTADFSVLTLTETSLLKAADGRSYKALLRLDDGHVVETVLIQTKKRLWTTCISCQVGCSVRCPMCATGKQGLVRNLDDEEISDQVLFWYQLARQGRVPSAPSNVVYMGMGEPFFNLENVFKSLDELMSPDGLNVGARHISVSTCGVVEAIPAFAERFPQVNLSISLHAANDDLRSALIPVNKKWPLAVLGDAVSEYLKICRRKLFFEYVMLSGVNDHPSDLKELNAFLKSIGERRLLHVNLIPYNDAGAEYKASPRKRVMEFQKGLEAAGWHVTCRRSLGEDIKAACGQLAGGES